MREMRGRKKWVRREMEDIGLKMIKRERGRWGRWGERERAFRLICGHIITIGLSQEVTYIPLNSEGGG